MLSAEISVIIATYNGEKYIKKQLDSILNQTVKPAEIIICDDCSTDLTVKIIDEHADNNIIKTFINKSKLGVVENFKKASQLSKKGNWIVFADQDDIWLPNKLSRLSAEMNLLDDKLTPALIFTDLAVIDKDDNIISDSFWKTLKLNIPQINFRALLFANVVTGCTMIINAPMAEEFSLMDNKLFLHDEWLALIAYSFGKVRYLNEALVLYRQHTSNVTYSESYKNPTFWDAAKLNFDFLIGKKKFLSRQVELAKAFRLEYYNRLENKDIDTLKDFISLENKNYIYQRCKRLNSHR